MGNFRPNTFTVIVLILFLVTLGVRRVIVRDQVEQLHKTMEELRMQEELAQSIENLVGLISKSDASIRGMVITHNPQFLVGFDDRTSFINESFTNFEEMARNQKILTEIETDRIRNLIQQKIEFTGKVKALCDQNKFEEAASIISTGMGPALTDSLGSLFQRNGKELQVMVNSTEAEYASRSKNESLISLVSHILMLSLLGWFLILLFKEMKSNAEVRSQLAEREEKLSVTLEGIADGVLTTDNSGNINYLNPVAESMLACKLKDVMGMTAKSVFTITNEDTNEPVDAMFDQVIVKGQKLTTRNHTILHSRDNKQYIIENSAAPMINQTGEITGMVVVFRDTTQKKVIQLALAKANNQFREIVQNAMHGIFRSTLEGKLILANPSMATIFEYESNEQMMQSVEDIAIQLYHQAADRAFVIEQLKTTGQVTGFEFQARTAKGNTIWVLLNIRSVYKADGKIDYLEGSIKNITERRLDRAKLEKQYAALKKYAYINSHEVRSHVATMLGLMRLHIDKHLTSDERETTINHLYDETIKLDEVVRKLSIIINEDRE